MPSTWTATGPASSSRFVLARGDQRIGVPAVRPVDVGVGDVEVERELPPDDRPIALLVAGRQADVLVEEERAHARERQALLVVPADEFPVGLQR
jgi:hypothetical protein